jgi:hypothetical protein
MLHWVTHGNPANSSEAADRGFIPHHPVQIVRGQVYLIVAGKADLSGRKPAINRRVTRAIASSS